MTGDSSSPMFTFSPQRLADSGVDEALRDAEWARVFAHFNPRLRTYFDRLCADDSELDDVLAETWRRVFIHIATLSVPVAAWSWMVTIGRNVLADHGRASSAQKRREEKLTQWREAEPASDEIALDWLHEDDLDGMPRGDAALKEIAALPPQDRDLLQLWAVMDVPHEQIAQRLGLASAAASRKRLQRIRKRLLDIIGPIRDPV